MEIDIPDLNDVEFVRECRVCRGRKTYDHYDSTAGPLRGKKLLPTGAIVTAACDVCHESGKELTPVGQRLMDFLKSLGLHIPNEDGWRQE